MADSAIMSLPAAIATNNGFVNKHIKIEQTA